MTGEIIKENGWTLHYTIGSVLAAPVRLGDTVHLPSGRGSVDVLGGRAPRRVNDTGAVQVTDSVTVGGLGARPGALGMVWISESGGWSELPE